MSGQFVHLHLHSEYSLVDGVIRLEPLVDAVASAGMPAVAVTDQSNLFALVKFYRAAIRAGVKPIIGVDVLIAHEEDGGQASRLVLLCQDHGGFIRLNRLITRSYLEGQQRGLPLLRRAWFTGETEGLIALSGGRAGDVGRALLIDNTEKARALLDEWQVLFPDRYYLELTRTGREDEERHVHAAVELALSTGVPVVATNDVHFLCESDYEAHEARVCIHEGRTLSDARRVRRYSEQQFLRDADDMADVFADIPEAIENTLEIARRCNLELTLGQNYLPDFPVPEDMTVDSYLRDQSRAGLQRRVNSTMEVLREEDSEEDVYRQRLEDELDVITRMGFAGYFLIVADFIQWAKQNEIPVGPGRGSGAGSLVAYALGITDLDPIRYELLFERFLNPERVSLPDFDVDFCMEQRDRVIDYVAERYGRDRVCQIITYGSMAAKAVVRDVGRVLGYPYGFVDQIARLIPFELKMTLEKALEQEEELMQRYRQDDDVHELIDLARKLEGLARNAGKHAGGVVIAPSALTDFTPLYCEQGASTPVTQLDMKDIEAVGLVKFDFLGLRTLTIIDWAVRTINAGCLAQGETPVDINDLPMDDELTFRLLKNCQTTAVFQLESRGMKDLIKRLQPDSFDEIVALVALFRPGPLQSGMVEDFINRKHGRARVHYPHPELEHILKPTYGVILYQEQVMQIAQVLAGYTLGGADLLRRAMGKKMPEEMAKQRSVFLKGAQGRGVDAETASYIFDLMEKFAGYGFNKSHSAAYALLAYQTAWLKARYPAAFMAAVLSADMDNTDKVVILIDECRSMGLHVYPPDINSCEYAFSSRPDGTILYGLGAIKGVGESAIDGIISRRTKEKPFRDLFDCCRRIDLKRANRRVLEALIRSGAMDGLGPNRATLLASLPDALKHAEQQHRDVAVGQNDFFNGNGTETNPDECFLHKPELSEEQRLLGEKETLGLYLTGHPITRYEKELEKITTTNIAKLRPSRNQNVVMAGLVIAMQTRNTRQGDRMAYITLDDRTARIEVAVFPEEYQSYRNLLAKDHVLVIEGSVSVDEYSDAFRMRALRIFDMEQAREAYARHLCIVVDESRAGNGFIHTLASILEPFREGHCPVRVSYRRRDAVAHVSLGSEWSVHPTDELLHRLRGLAGDDYVEIVY